LFIVYAFHVTFLQSGVYSNNKNLLVSKICVVCKVGKVQF